ncbi:MAG: CotH kinase family protein [Deltaproteobacteria bacterium]|nr:CotH kinase family protein [Kofleriaceae bacterium]
MRRLEILVCVAMLAACGGDDAVNDDGGVDGGGGLDAGVDPSEALFPRDRIIEVQITLAAADWDTLRVQEPGPPEATCAGPPGVDAYTYFPATITIDGATVASVGVRKKGNLGSLSTTRPGLKVKANEYVSGQRIAGLKQLTLNNNKQDETLVSQCLGYGLFRQAGLPAPRCAFAHVTVNGADLGVYTHVESIRDQFLTRHFGDDGGNLFESGGDFVPGGTGGFQPKNDEDMPDCSALDAVATALQAPPAELASRVGAVVELDAFMRFWAMEVVTGHWDGYANNRNNYFVYQSPATNKLSFIPWGADALFEARVRSTRPQAVYACGALAWKLYDTPSTRALYLAALRDVLDTVWDADTIVAEIDRMQALLRPLADPGNTGAYAVLLDGVRQDVRAREALLRAELDAGDPAWPYAADESCLVSIGTIDASFATTWGTLDTFDTGSGSMSGVVGGVDTMTSTVLAGAGLDAEGKAALQVLGRLPDGRYAVLFLGVSDPASFRPGSLPVDLRNVFALMTFYDPATDTASGGGLVLPGTLTLGQAATTAGAPVSGSFTGTVIEL